MYTQSGVSEKLDIQGEGVCICMRVVVRVSTPVIRTGTYCTQITVTEHVSVPRDQSKQLNIFFNPTLKLNTHTFE